MRKAFMVTALVWCVIFSLIMLVRPDEVVFTLFWVTELIVAILNLLDI